MTKAEVAKIWVMLLGAYPAAKQNEATGRIYESMLEDLDAEACVEAVKRLFKTSRFLPTIAEIRSMAVEVRHGALRSPEEAWGDVVDAIRSVGSYRVPKFKDPLVAYAVERLGWRNLCLEGSSDVADRARFCELYGRAAERSRQDEVTGHALPERPHGLVGGRPMLSLLTSKIGVGS